MPFTPAVLLVALLAFLLGAVLVHLLRAGTLAALRQQQQELQAQQQGQALELARQQERTAALQAQEKEAQQLRERLEDERRQLERSLRERDARLAEVETRLQAERQQIEEKLKFAREQEQVLKLQFEQLATRIFEEKSQKFSEQNKAGLDGLLSPLREQLKDFREKVENTYNNEARERFALKEQIIRLEGLNKQISDDAGNLARVLEESGLHEGREYITQFSTRDDEGRRLVPDAIVRLPEGRDIVVDSKVSLNDYVLYCEADDEDERRVLLKKHTDAVRNHIRSLSEKRYEDLPELRTLDFVFMFMPVEAAFMLAVEHDKALFTEAFDRRIVIVSPTTLLATLRTVESIWRHEIQNKHSEEIARQAGQLHDKFATLLEHLEKIGGALDSTQKHFRNAVSSLSGHGGLVGRVERLRELGAKAKKALPLAKLDLDTGHAEDGLPEEDRDTENTAS